MNKKAPALLRLGLKSNLKEKSMYYIKNYDECINNVALLPGSFSSEIHKLETLKLAYIEFLKDFQTEIPAPISTKTPFDTNKKTENKLTEFLLLGENTKDPFSQPQLSTEYTKKEKQLLLESTNQGIDLIKKYDKQLSTLFYLYINHILFIKTKNSIGGSASGAIGVIRHGGNIDWNTTDNAEFIVHELTHNIVFLDELIYPYYDNHELMMDEKNWAYSAILNTRRPISKVLHSIIVAHAILNFRNKLPAKLHSYNVHCNSKQLINQTLDAIDSVNSVHEKTGILSKVGVNILKICKNIHSIH